MTQIFVYKKGALRDIDKTALRKAGVLIVEVAGLEDFKLIDATEPINGTAAAVRRATGMALKASSNAQAAFAIQMAEEMVNP